MKWAIEAKGLGAKLASFRLESMRYNLNTKAENIKPIEQRMVAAKDDIVATLTAMAGALPPAKGGNAAKAILTEVQAQIEPVLAKIIPIINTNANGRAEQLYATTVQETQDHIDTYTTQLIDNAVAQMAESITGVDRLSSLVFRTMLIGSAAGFVVCLLLAWWIIRAITRKLQDIINSLGESASMVNMAAGQISSSSQTLAEGATSQAASLEETSSALEQMASMTRQNADNATLTNETTQNNNKLISHGAEAVNNMSTAMTEIDASAERISRIIRTIEDIAFQTNLLALNAAVEAARAGEAGKGFAVVADEVCNLASRSAQAAKETTELIQGTIERVKNGSEIAGELDSSFREIEGGSQAVSEHIGEITTATNEQAQGVDQLNTAMAQMDKVTQQNAAAAEESASAAEELSAQATVLNTMVEDLVTLVNGGDGSGAQPRLETTRGRARQLSAPASRKKTGGNGRNGGNGGVKVVKSSDVIPLDEF